MLNLLLVLALADSLGPEVRQYVRVDAPKVILEQVEVIDGTGAAPVADRNITIEGGKITAISAGSDQPPSNGTTVLDLKGYTVMPGIVGMHDHLWYQDFAAREPPSRSGRTTASRSSRPTGTSRATSSGP